jgi:putative toxin-antitoxin system antitoxin component (TIGR02293 family)
MAVLVGGRASSVSWRQPDLSASVEKITWQLLGGKLFMAKEPSTNIDFLVAGNLGIKKDVMQHLALALDIPMKDMAVLLSLSYKTISRMRKADRLGSLESSLAIEMARVMAKGLTIFEDIDVLRSWLKKRNRALAGQRPIDLFHTPTGINNVHSILVRIEEGVYS